MNNFNKKNLINLIAAKKERSAWYKGVQKIALEQLEDRDDLEKIADLTEKNLLNGADTWKEYVEGACGRLIYSDDIAELLCTPSELKATRHGERQPNNHETWLDVYARANRQAFQMIWTATYNSQREQLSPLRKCLEGDSVNSQDLTRLAREWFDELKKQGYSVPEIDHLIDRHFKNERNNSLMCAEFEAYLYN